MGFNYEGISLGLRQLKPGFFFLAVMMGGSNLQLAAPPGACMRSQACAPGTVPKLLKHQDPCKEAE